MRGQAPQAPFDPAGLLDWAKRLVAWMNLELGNDDGDEDMWDEFGFEVQSTSSPIVALAAPTAPKKRILKSITVACPGVAVGSPISVTLQKKVDTTVYDFLFSEVYDEQTLNLPEGAFQVLDGDDESIQVTVADNGGAEMVHVTGVYGESRD